MPAAAAVLYQTVGGEKVPIWITPKAVPDSDVADIIQPQMEVAVWFQLKTASGTIVDETVVKAFTIPMLTATMSAADDVDGRWSTTTDKVLYPLDDNSPFDTRALSQEM